MSESDFLAKCLELTKHVLDEKMTAYISIKIGEGFAFTFNNQERDPLFLKKKSPSQYKRDQERIRKYRQKKKQDDDAKEHPEAEVSATNDEKVIYEMKFDAPNCSDDEIKECIDFNVKDEFKRKNVRLEDTKYELKSKDSKLTLKKTGENFRSLKTFVIEAKNTAKVKEALDVFTVTWEFDNLGFKGAEKDKKQANLREFKKI